MPGWPIAAALAVVCVFLYYVRIVLLPFIVAGAIAFVLSPLIERLHKRYWRLPRWAAATLVYVAVLACLAVFARWAGPVLAADLAEIMAGTPHALHHLANEIAPGGNIIVFGQPIDIEAMLSGLFAQMRSWMLSDQVLAIAADGITAVAGLFLGLVLLIYFLVSGPTLARGLLWIVPPEYRAEVARVAVKVAPVLRRYVVGIAVVVLYTSVTSWIAFAWVFRVQHAPLLAITVGLLELIPVFGPLSSIVLVGITALEQSSLTMAATLAAFAILLRLSIDQVVGPLVLGRAAYVHPVVVMFAFLSGGVFLGVLGLVLAVPVAAATKIVLTHYYDEQVVD